MCELLSVCVYFVENTSEEQPPQRSKVQILKSVLQVSQQTNWKLGIRSRLTTKIHNVLHLDLLHSKTCKGCLIRHEWKILEWDEKPQTNTLKNVLSLWLWSQMGVRILPGMEGVLLKPASVANGRQVALHNLSIHWQVQKVKRLKEITIVHKNNL